MIIPRENKLVRLYIQLTEAAPCSGRVDKSKITPEFIFKAAQKIMSPYKLDYHYCDWYADPRATLVCLYSPYAFLFYQVDCLSDWTTNWR